MGGSGEPRKKSHPPLFCLYISYKNRVSRVFVNLGKVCRSNWYPTTKRRRSSGSLWGLYKRLLLIFFFLVLSIQLRPFNLCTTKVMELRLSLGDDSKPFGFLEKPCDQVGKEDLGFCMGLSIGTNIPREKEVEEKQREDVAAPDEQEDEENDQSKGIYPNPPLQLDLLPHIPVCRTNPPPYHASVPWPPENGT